MTEHQAQVAFVNWFRLAYPGVLIFAIPNGGLRNKVTAARLKAEGARAGVPDLFVPEWRLFIEMKKTKAEGGRLSQAQREMVVALRKAGYETAVCYGLDEAKHFVASLAPPADAAESKAAMVEAYKTARRAKRA